MADNTAQPRHPVVDAADKAATLLALLQEHIAAGGRLDGAAALQMARVVRELANACRCCGVPVPAGL
jgi:hypothetical protein